MARVSLLGRGEGKDAAGLAAQAGRAAISAVDRIRWGQAAHAIFLRHLAWRNAQGLQRREGWVDHQPAAFGANHPQGVWTNRGGCPPALDQIQGRQGFVGLGPTRRSPEQQAEQQQLRRKL